MVAKREQGITDLFVRYHEMRGLQSLQARVGAFTAPTFPSRTTRSITKHIEKEVRELLDAVEAGDVAGARIECADIIILAVDYANRAGFDLYEAVNEKFEIVKRRTWGEPDENGVVEHVRDGQQ